MTLCVARQLNGSFRSITRESDWDEVGDWQRWLLKSEAHRQAFAEFED